MSKTMPTPTPQQYFEAMVQGAQRNLQSGVPESQLYHSIHASYRDVVPDTFIRRAARVAVQALQLQTMVTNIKSLKKALPETDEDVVDELEQAEGHLIDARTFLTHLPGE